MYKKSKASAKSQTRHGRRTSRGTKRQKRSSQRHGPSNVASAVVIKDQDLFFLCDSNGDVPLNNDQGFGLYYHDCRFLQGYRLRIADTRLNALASTSEHGFMSEFVLTNPDLRQASGEELPKQSVTIHWRRIIQAASLTLQDVLELTNRTTDSIQCDLAFDFQAGFEDVFEIRGLHPKKIGRAEKPSWRKDALVFDYDGADGIYRTLQVAIQAPSLVTRKDGADLQLRLAPKQMRTIHLSLTISESPKKKKPILKTRSKPDTNQLADALHKNSDQWLQAQTRMESDNRLFNRAFERCLRDLRVLRASLDGQEYFSAGLPWYGALFGRDSIISSLQTLAFDPRIAEQTLRLLAKYQGKETSEWRDEHPGKILHELRVGELAHLNEIPQTPYYGSVDSTPLFLVLVARHANWTGSLSLFRDLREPIERAFDWITRFGDQTGSGYLEYSSESSAGLGNQGWKDSGDAIVNADGSLATTPIALVEVQGYVYLAKTSIAELYERSGDNDAAERLRAEAHELRTRFERDFWLEDKAIYALALQAGRKPCAVVSSNPGQMLWSGMADPARAKRTATQLMSPEMFTGWGIRTLSSTERRYNPVGYHLGTVWPHDNSIIAAGLRAYGLDESACKVFEGIVEAAGHFGRHRLPEVFGGYAKDEFSVPVRYPVACHPQAWAAGSVPFMIESLLGLKPHAFENNLQIVRPVLPNSISRLELSGLRVGTSTVDLRFERKAENVTTTVIRVEGNLDVEVSNALPKAA